MKFIHLRDDKGLYATIAYRAPTLPSGAEPVRVEAAYSVCSSIDNFSRKSGRNIAEARLTNFPNKYTRVFDWYDTDTDGSYAARQKQIARELIEALDLRRPGKHRSTS